MRRVLHLLLGALFLFSAQSFAQDDYSQWKFSTTININTMNTGSTVRADNYPLLIRLTTDNFPFGLAKGDGSDVRFSTAGGAHLQYDMDFYDSANGEAAFWVLLSELHPNNNQQPFKMYWGKANAADSSNPSAVFGSSNNYAAVWHLGESPAGGTDAVKDRTSNNNHATSSGSMTNSDLVDARIGKGIDFDGDDDWLNAGSHSSLDNLSDLTISVWVYSRSWPNTYPRILEKSNASRDGLSCFMANNTSNPQYGDRCYALFRDMTSDTTVVRSAAGTVSLNQWVHFSVVLDRGSFCRMYRNGVEINYSTNRVGNSSLISDASYNMYLGNRSDGIRGLDGVMDELRIATTPRSSGWIKYDYHSQKSGQDMVSITPLSAAIITSEPTPDTALTGSSGGFAINAMGEEPISYRWEKKSGSSWSTISGATSKTYTIPSVAKSNAGVYRVRIWNSQGRDTSAEASLTVFDPPQVTTQPDNQSVSSGQTATFSVVATGDQLSYQWQLDPPGTGGWADISGATSASYTTPAATSGMSGSRYRCNVFGAAGSSDQSDPATLSVEQTAKPEIVTDLMSYYLVLLGDTADLSIVAVGQQPLRYQWEKREGSTWNALPGDTTNTYTINGMSPSYVGVYRVTVSNDSGSATSKEATVGMSDSLQIIENPKDDTVLVGQTFTFSVVAGGGQDPITYQWLRRAGGAFQNIPGATNSTYSKEADTADNGVWFRCAVASGAEADTSREAILTLGSLPKIALSPKDKAVPVNANVDLTITATGIPRVQYKWYYKYRSDPPTLLDSGYTLTEWSLTRATKTDSGAYYVMVSNKFGDALSDSGFVHVLEGVTIDQNLPSQYVTRHGGTAPLSIGIMGDGRKTFQWLQDGVAIPGATVSRYVIDTVDSAQHHRKLYSCQVKNQFVGRLDGVLDTVQIGSDLSRLCTLVVSEYNNPFKLRVERVSDQNVTQARVKLWSEENISSFPYDGSAFERYADSLWVFYKTFGFPTTLQNAGVSLVPIKAIVDAYPDTLIDTIPVSEIPANNDSSYYFSYSVKWHKPEVPPDTLLRPFIEANKVPWIDTTAAPNGLVLRGTYFEKSDSMQFVFDSCQAVVASRDSKVYFQGSYVENFSVIAFEQTFVAHEFLGIPSLPFMQYQIDKLPIEKKTLYCRWFIEGINSSISLKKDTSFIVGWDRPIWSGTFDASQGSKSNKLNVSWSNVGVVDSMRFWHSSTDTIPLEHSYDILFQATNNQPKTIPTPAQPTDSIEELTSSTKYNVAAQFYKDMMWTRITPMSRDTATTKDFDIDEKVPNVISVDTTWFDPVTNEVVMEWHLYRTIFPPPPNSIYKTGYSYTLRSFIDSTFLVIGNDSVTTDSNVTRFTIPDVQFDTTYTVGLWLWFQESSTGGESRKNFPTDSSRTKVSIPSFTWEIVNFFPTSGANDVVPVANGKIVLRELTDFGVNVQRDTIRSYNRIAPLPSGFFPIEAQAFRFCKSNYQIPSFIIEIPYKNLPVGVTKDDLGLYRDIDGKMHAVHGFKVDENMVFAKISKEDLNVQNKPYPFVVLADTSTPVVTYAIHEEIVAPGANVRTEFTIRDNVANVATQFLHGPGHKIFERVDPDTLKDTTANLTGIIRSEYVNADFGTRAWLVVDDGVNKDTINVSRSVKTDQAEYFPIGAMEWTPLRTASPLMDSTTAAIYGRSFAPQEWVYDKTKYRLFRYYTPQLDTNDWMEYSETSVEHFNFVPGRLIWYKTTENVPIQFGEGYTTSMRQPYEIVCRAGTYTDFCLPYKFPVMLRDVLATTGIKSDSLEFYHWVKDSTTYKTNKIYVALLDKYTPQADTSVLIYQAKSDGYTVYNKDTADIIMRIPPLCRALSQPISLKKRGASKEQLSKWNISLLWKDRERHSLYREIICAYNNSIAGQVHGSLPPSFDKVAVGIYDSANNSLHGYAIQNNVEQGGATFPIVFSHDSDELRGIEYTLDKSVNVPDGYEVKVLNPANKAYEKVMHGQTGSIDLSQDEPFGMRYVVVGTPEYLNHMLHMLSPARFAILKTYPNPFTGMIKLQYTLPPHIRELSFSLYNVRGQKLLHRNIRDGLTPGAHVLTLDMRSNVRGAMGSVSAGVYILRMTAKDVTGATLYGGERRITCIK